MFLSWTSSGTDTSGSRLCSFCNQLWCRHKSCLHLEQHYEERWIKYNKVMCFIFCMFCDSTDCSVTVYSGLHVQSFVSWVSSLQQKKSEVRVARIKCLEKFRTEKWKGTVKKCEDHFPRKELCRLCEPQNLAEQRWDWNGGAGIDVCMSFCDALSGNVLPWSESQQPIFSTLKDGNAYFRIFQYISYIIPGMWVRPCLHRGSPHSRWSGHQVISCRASMSPSWICFGSTPPTLSRFGVSLCGDWSNYSWISQGGKWLANSFRTWQCPSHQSLLGELQSSAHWSASSMQLFNDFDVVSTVHQT